MKAQLFLIVALAWGGSGQVLAANPAPSMESKAKQFLNAAASGDGNGSAELATPKATMWIKKGDGAEAISGELSIDVVRHALADCQAVGTSEVYAESVRVRWNCQSLGSQKLVGDFFFEGGQIDHVVVMTPLKVPALSVKSEYRHG